ncbi:MAG: hypothetical protein K0R60_1810 [Microbacterium sp.]|nr:hypothetical protein [Microbacterium sp.]
MPPVMNPVGPAFEMVTITMAPTLPSMGRSEVSMLLPPSFGTSSGGGCTTIRPLGTDGGARRGPLLTKGLRSGG